MNWTNTAWLPAICLYSSLAVAGEPMRIVSLSPHATELVFALGAGDRLVGTSEHSDYPEAAKAIPRISGYQGVQMEKLLELQPDLIITWSGGNQADDLERLAQLGFTLYDSSPKAPVDIAEDLQGLGEVLGKQAEAEALASDFRLRLQRIEQTYADRAPVRVFYQLWHEPLMSVGRGSWLDPLISACGGQNVFHETLSPYPQVSLEHVVLAAPEAILLPQERGGANVRDTWSAWPQIPAVASERFYELDADLLHRTTPRMLDGLDSLCRAIDQARRSL